MNKFSRERMLFRLNFFGLSGQEVPMDWLHQSEAKYPSSCNEAERSALLSHALRATGPSGTGARGVAVKRDAAIKDAAGS